MFNLFYVETKRTWLTLIRYPMEAVAVVAMLVILFYGLFLGASYMAGGSAGFGDRLDSIVVGYVVWMLVVGVFSGIGGDIATEIQTGTMEQIFIARRSFLLVSLVRAIANLGLNLFLTIVMMVIIMALTGTWLSFDVAILLPLAIVILCSLGLGLFMGGVTIVVKRTRGILGIAQFGFIFLMMTPFETFTGAAGTLDEFLPLAKGTGLIRQTMAEGAVLDQTDILIAAGNSLAYFLIGCLCFTRWIAQAKKQGTLVHY